MLYQGIIVLLRLKSGCGPALNRLGLSFKHPTFNRLAVLKGFKGVGGKIAQWVGHGFLFGEISYLRNVLTYSNQIWCIMHFNTSDLCLYVYLLLILL